MTAPRITITLVPPVVGAEIETFNDEAEQYVNAQAQLGPQINAVSEFVHDKAIEVNSAATTATTKATEAATSAATAGTAATTATTKADEAATSAATAATAVTTAGTKAGEAATSAASASTAAAWATTQADGAATSASTASAAATTATTKAGEAVTSASIAGTAATTATTKAGEASTSATTATTKAGEAATSAATAGTAATTATTKATEASASASAANQAKLDAQAAAQQAAGGGEPTIIAGTTGQYWRGDKSWQTLDKAAVGLGNVNNTADANKPVSTAQQAALETKVDKTAVGAANGVAPLGADSKIASTYLPSYVDDVLEYANAAGRPATGETGKIYVTLNDNKIFRWSGSAYVEISGSPGSTDAVTEGATNLYYTAARAAGAAPVQSVAGRTGTVVLTKADVGLSNVDNTADANKPVSTAQQAALDTKQSLVESYTTTTGSINFTAGTRFKLAMNGNITLSITNPPAAGSGYTGVIEIAYTSGTLTLPAGSTKAGNLTLVSGNTYLLFFNRGQAGVWQFVMTQGIV